MAWVKLDDQFPDHPKVAKAGPLASWLYVCGLAYCARELSDGWVPDSLVAACGLSHRETAALVNAGLWAADGDGFRIIDFLRNGFVADQDPLDALRAEARRRFGAVIFDRDGHRCVTCGSLDDLTLDHIIPLSRGGTNEATNLQTLCRPCNSRKGAR